MPPAAAMATLLSSWLARFPKAKQAGLRTAALLGCVFMTASMACRGKGEVGVSIWCVGGVRVGVVGVRGKVVVKGEVLEVRTISCGLGLAWRHG